MEVGNTANGINTETDNNIVNLLAGLSEDFVLVGTVAPAGGGFGLYTGLVAAELAMRGKSVRILSPDRRSAADKTIPTGPGLLPHLTVEAKKAKALILSLEPGLPFSPNLTRVPRAVMLNAAALAIKAFPVRILICDTPIQVPGGIGGRTAQSFWTSFDHIVVRGGEDLTQIRELPYVDMGKVIVAEPFADSFFDTGNLSERAYDEDLIASFSSEQVAYLLHLRAGRARQMTDAANDFSLGTGEKNQAVGAKASLRELKSSFYTAKYVYNRSKAVLKKLANGI